MRPIDVMKKWMKGTTILLLAALGTSCTTTYDAYGNQRQSVDPAGAAIGAVALGALAYSVGRSRGKRAERRRNAAFVQPGWGGWGGGGWGYHPGAFCR